MATVGFGFKITEDIVIQKLSGPVSMRILTPNTQSEYFKKYKNAPVLIMLGDIHFSDKNICTGPGVSHIFRPDFLKKLCDALVENEIIDFYMEGTNVSARTNYVEDPQGPLMAILNLIIECNKPVKAQKYKDIDKVKWHHTDMRFWTSETKELAEMPDKKPIKYCSMLDFLLQKVERDELFRLNPNQKTFAITFKAYSIVLQRQNYKLESNYTANVLQIYNKLVNNRYSVINYLISQIKNSDDKTFIKNQINKYIEYVYSLFCAKVGMSAEALGKFIIAQQNRVVELFNHADYRIDSLYDNDYVKYSDYVVTMDSIKLDAMTMVKSFMRMLQSSNSIINICYFGDTHIKNMCAFMPTLLQSGTSPAAYTEVLNVTAIRGNPGDIVNEEPGRCLDFTAVRSATLSKILDALRASRKI